MKKLTGIIFAILLAFTASVVKAEGASHQGVKHIGLAGTGFYEISDYESIYVNFVASNLKTAGGGAQLFFDYGFSDRFGGGMSLGYSRITYTNSFQNVIKENFFTADFLGQYYFTGSDSTFQPYAAAGAGILVSGAGIAPLFDVGVGSYIKLADNFSLKIQALYKTAVIHHRMEGSFGFAYNF